MSRAETLRVLITDMETAREIVFAAIRLLVIRDVISYFERKCHAFIEGTVKQGRA